MAAERGLPALQRFITTHDANGKAVFLTELSPSTPEQPVMDAVFGLAYTTTQFPVQMKDDTDITSYKNHLGQAPGLVVPSGTVLRYVDMPPNCLSPMHRTVSLDYGVVLQGEVALVLDSGEERILKQGDIAIQRGTNHAWRNTSNDKWVRMLFILQPSYQLELNGSKLGEDLADMKDVRKSD
jgi:quercetin dioxygenase-like cupin family protein